MIKTTEILEAFQAGKFPDISSDEFQHGYPKILTQATKLVDVRKNYALYEHNNIYLLVKNDGTIVGMLRLADTTIASKAYLEVIGIFVPIEYRKTPAIYWLLYAVKESVNKDVVADGAIFDDGQALINAIQKHNMFHVFDLNKETGVVSEVTKPLTSVNHCYLFKTTKLGFGEQMFVEGMSFIWYPLFGEIEEIVK